MSDAYTPPKAELHNEVETGQYGSVERALTGNYQFDIGDILKEAWDKVLGAKTTIAIAVAIPTFISIVIGFLDAPSSSSVASFNFKSIILSLLTYAITLPMFAGVFIIALKRSVNAPINFNQILQHWDKTLRLLGLYIVMSVLTLIGFVLLVVPGIYLAIAYSFAIPLMVEKDMGIWEALETSRKAVTKKWFHVFGLGIASIVIMVAGAIALLVGLFWAAPLVIIAFGIAYRNIFGIEEKTLKV